MTASACVLADGAWGTEFQKLGLEPGASPERWNLEHPDRVARVARSYVDSGSRVILTNTFGASRLRLADQGFGELVREINLAGVRIAARARDAGATLLPLNILIGSRDGPS